MGKKSVTDHLNLNEQKFFKIIKETLPDNKIEPQNIIVCKDDTIFAWNNRDCCVLAFNIAAIAKNNGVKHQVSGIYIKFYDFLLTLISFLSYLQTSCN